MRDAKFQIQGRGFDELYFSGHTIAPNPFNLNLAL